MATKINVRSPFYIKVSDSDLQSARLQLYIYEGTKDDTPDAEDLKYTIFKTELEESNYVVFEISELVRDYLDIEFDGQYDSQCVWVNPVIRAFDEDGDIIYSPTVTPSDYSDQFIAFDGYGYFEEGINPELSTSYLQSNNTIFRLDDQNVRIPIFVNGTNSVTFLYKGEVKRTLIIPDILIRSTLNEIDYITVSGSDNTDTYKQRVLADGGTLELTPCLNAFLDTIDIGLVDELYIASDSGTQIVKIVTEPCGKYEPYKVTFVNKFGVLQDIWFSLKSTESINAKSETYKASVLDFNNLTYSISKPQMTQFHKSAKESITLNTNYLSEDYNEVIKQLMMSEQVWITKLTDEELVLPVIPKTESLRYKTRVNDKLVQYTIEFDYAFDKINNIR